MSLGTQLVIPRVRSLELGNTRDLHVYLPPGYEESDERYPVLYLQDGQNLFDDAIAFAGAWHAEDAADAASRLGHPCIIVGIANTGIGRIAEYSPFIDARVGGGSGDRYLSFLIDTVKARIDRELRTLPGREHTVIGGASMGGLISLYAFFRHPAIFGRAAVQSASLWFAGGAIFDYVDESPYFPGRIYTDVGAGEGANTLRNARRLRDQLRDKGYVMGETLHWVEDRKGTHSEHAWGKRLRKALPFLLEPDAA